MLNSCFLAIVFAHLALCQPISFNGRRDIPANQNPYGIVVGDFNADGKPDMVVTNSSANTISIMLGNGDASFQLPQSKSVGGVPRGIAAGDFNGDSKLDVVTANVGSNNVSVLLGKGDGTFQDAANIATGTSPYAVAVADFNGDNKADLVVANYGGNSVSVLLGNGSGAFQPAPSISVNLPFSVAVGDLNADGKADIAVPNYLASTVSILYGKGDGTFEAATTVATGPSPTSVVLADLNGDDIIDIATSNAASYDISILLGDGNGAFQPSNNVQAGWAPHALAAGDINGDKKPDLVVANTVSNNVWVIFGNGSGAFGPAYSYDVGAAPYALALGDVNGDGKLDVMAPSNTQMFVSLLAGGADGRPQGTVMAIQGSCVSDLPPAMADYNGDSKIDLARGGCSEIQIAAGNGNGTFRTPTSLAVSSDVRALVAGDYNGDGKADLAAALANGTQAVFLGRGDGTFQAGASYNVGVTNILATADFNNDGKADLAAAGSGAGTVYIFAGNGNGTFQAPQSIASLGYWIAVGDFNGDARLDIAGVQFYTVKLALGNGNGTFQTPKTIPVSGYPCSANAADFDSNGTLDLAVTDCQSNSWSLYNIVQILPGAGDGTFRSPKSLPGVSGYNFFHRAAGDFDGDGKLDIAAYFDSGVSGIAVFHGRGNAEFDAPVLYGGMVGSVQSSVADLNSDNKLDLVGEAGGIYPLLNNTILSPTTTIASNPTGRTFTADGVAYTAPQIFSWTPGSTHEIQWLSNQPDTAGTRTRFSAWADGDTSNPRTVTTTTGAQSYTANFAFSYQLTASPGVAGTGTIAASPASSDGYYAAGATVQLTATAGSGYVFAGFSGDLSGTTNPQNIVMSAPRSVTANFLRPLTVTPGTISLTFTAGGTSNLVQTVSVTGPSQNYTATLTVQTPAGGTWLTLNSGATQVSGAIPGSFTATANPTGLQAGTYNATITVNSPGLAAVSIPVTLTSSGQPLALSIPSLLVPANDANGASFVVSGGPYGPASTLSVTAYGTIDLKGGTQSTNAAGTQVTGTIGGCQTSPVAPVMSACLGALLIGNSTIGWFPLFAHSPTQTSTALSLLNIPLSSIFGPSIALTNGATLSLKVNDSNYSDNSGAFGIGAAPPPSVSIVQPNAITQYSSSALTITGNNFDPGTAIVNVRCTGCQAVTPTLASKTAFQIQTAPMTWATAGAYQITVQNGLSGPASAPVTINVQSGARFVALTPCRVVDTRGSAGVFGGPKLDALATRTFPIQQSGCGVPGTALAYSLNFTVVPTGPLGYLATWPTGQTRPLVSTLNSPEGRIAANAAIVPAGQNGSIDVYVTGSADVIIDINGYFDNSTAAMPFYVLAPCRVVDTRGPSGPLGQPALAALQQRNFPAAGNCGIPQGAQALSLNATVVPGGPLGYLTLWPTGRPQPFVSTLNSPDGGITANAALTPLGSGSLSAYATDNTDLVLDVNGYFSSSGNGAPLTFYPIAPCRIADTRGPAGTFGGPSLNGVQARSFPVTQSGCNVPSTARAFSLNVTAVPAGPLAYLTVWPSDQPLPVASTLNSPKGSIVANAAIVPASTSGAVNVYATSATDVVLDINGYFAP